MSDQLAALLAGGPSDDVTEIPQEEIGRALEAIAEQQGRLVAWQAVLLRRAIQMTGTAVPTGEGRLLTAEDAAARMSVSKRWPTVTRVRCHSHGNCGGVRCALLNMGSNGGLHSGGDRSTVLCRKETCL